MNQFGSWIEHNTWEDKTAALSKAKGLAFRVLMRFAPRKTNETSWRLMESAFYQRVRTNPKWFWIPRVSMISLICCAHCCEYENYCHHWTVICSLFEWNLQKRFKISGALHLFCPLMEWAVLMATAADHSEPEISSICFRKIAPAIKMKCPQ
jgi:hypothetical protein